MKKLLMTMAVGLVALTAVGSVQAGDSEDVIRVGVYDNRIVAIAYGNSDYLPVAAKKAELKAAKEAGDSAKIAELETWGPKYQRQLHRQGFGRVPVDDLLAYVGDKIPALAEKLGVDIIAMHCDFTGDNVEVVDVSMELAKLFNPDEKIFEVLGEVKDHEPVDLDDLDHDH